MDSRLSRLDGQRLHRLRKEDLPELATALIAHSKRAAKVTNGNFRGSRFVQLTGLNVNIAILTEDWVYIDPLLKAGLLNSPIQNVTALTNQLVATLSEALFKPIRVEGIASEEDLGTAQIV